MLCGGARELVFQYESPPPDETLFRLPEGQTYEREVQQCLVCGHMMNVHSLDPGHLYEGDYVDAAYGADGLESAFDRIMELPPDRSDNVQRVRRIASWWEAWRDRSSQTVLDVGSGLAVFPARMKEAGWRCTAVDPDPRAAEHARNRAEVEAVAGDFMAIDALGRFGLITFNKVLEHVEDPVAMLARSHEFLEESGAVYVEVPDGEAAATDPDGRNREEFFIEHVCAFSMASLCLLARLSGFAVQRAERLRDPSGKYTLFAFLY